MWQGMTNKQTRPIIPKNYPSKFINQFMNSDSQEDQQIYQQQSMHSNQQSLFKDKNYVAQNQTIKNNNNNSKVPPLVSLVNKQNYNNNIVTDGAINNNYKINSNVATRQARQIRQARQSKQSINIKYNCFRLDGNKLVQIIPNNQYNSITLQQTSIIKANDQILINQLQKFRQQNKQLHKKFKQLQNENKNIKRQLNITKQQLETKDNYYQDIQNKLTIKQKQLQEQIKRYGKLEHQFKQLEIQKQNKMKSVNQQPIGYKKRQSQLSQYISNKFRANTNCEYNSGNNQSNAQTSYRKNNQNSQKIYADICKYIIVRVQQFKSRLINYRMSKSIEDIIDQFMTQIVNINQITVSRVVNKNKLSYTPTRSYTNLRTQDNTNSNVSNIFKQSHIFQSVTPPKRIEQQTKSNDLLNLQKSLQKLRDMEKSFVTNSPNITNVPINRYQTTTLSNNYKDSYTSLDKSSSLIGLDRSNRSKSRRKKIFQ